MITDHDGLRQVLDALLLPESDFAVLHKERELAEGTAESDADLATRLPLPEALDLLWARAAALDMKLLSVWHYDTVSASSFLLSRRGIVQIDILSDLRGKGKYGIRTGVAVAAAVPGVRWPRLDPIDEQLYLIRKRWVKRDIVRLTSLIEDVSVGQCDSRHRRSVELFAYSAHRSVLRALAGRRPRRRQLPRVARVPDLIRRLNHPSGVQVDLRLPVDQWPSLRQYVRTLMPRAAVHTGPLGVATRARRWIEIRRPCLSVYVTDCTHLSSGTRGQSLPGIIFKALDS